MTMTSYTVDGIPIAVDDIGAGRPVLLLHGGAGPHSVAGFAAQLAEAAPARVLIPTHPGFGGTARPESLDSIGALAHLYAQMLFQIGLEGVTVIGNSVGGWIAAELGLIGAPQIGRVVLVDAAGLQLDEHPIADFFSLTLEEVAQLSYFRPETFRPVPLPEAVVAGNRAALKVYGGTAMVDSALLDRLPKVNVPTLVVWGAADRIVPVQHGEAYAAAIPGARLHVIPNAGHLPQLETPDELVRLVRAFESTVDGLR